MQFSTGHVNIDFDPETFQFSKETHDFGGVTQIDLSPLTMGYSQIDAGVKVNFTDMSLYASSYLTYSPESLTGNFNAYFNFTPQAGYKVTGYTVTFEGNYNIETPGSIGVGTTTAGPFTQVTGGGPFTFSADVAGSAAPALQGSLSALGDLTTLQVLDGYNQVLDHYESVLDYCDTEDPFTCYYHDEPVYIEVPIYHDETDLGEASVTLQSATIQAHVAPVPEPGVVTLVVGGLPVLALWAKRRRSVT